MESGAIARAAFDKGTIAAMYRQTNMALRLSVASFLSVDPMILGAGCPRLAQ